MDMSLKTGRTASRKATRAQESAMAHTISCLETDIQATADLGAGSGDDLVVYGNLPDEEIDAVTKVDFSVLGHSLMEVTILEEVAVRLLQGEDLYGYISRLTEAVLFYVGEYQAVAEQLGNARELSLNQRNDLFGCSSQRSSSLFGEKAVEAEHSTSRKGKKRSEASEGSEPASDGQNAPDPCMSSAWKSGEAGREDMENGNGTDVKEDGQEHQKGQPKRTAGCAAKIYEDATVRHIYCEISESELNSQFGEAGWKEMPSGERLVTEYSVIPATVIVKIYHLCAYCAKDCTDPDAPGVVRAESPVIRAREKSPISSGMMANIMYERDALRIPVNRISSHLVSEGLKITPQRLYENLRYYDGYFRILLEHMWTILLSSRYIQVDETPVRYYDKSLQQSKRGYLWVFTTSEMLQTEYPVTLFFYAQGRGADVLSRCLQGFSGVVGSDGHSAYHVFERESQGEVSNAGCLDHFRKRVVAALRAVPNLKEMSTEERLRIPAYAIMLKLNRVFQLDRETKMLDTKEKRDEYRKGMVNDAFDELVETTLSADLRNCPVESYTSRAVKYMRNQEIYLRGFLEDSNIASNNSKCERKFAFFATLRNQIKMFGSFRGAETAATFESIEQTAREYIPNTRIYYKYLIEKMCPFIREKRKENPDVDFSSVKEIKQFYAWSPEYRKYEKETKKSEEILKSVIENF